MSNMAVTSNETVLTCVCLKWDDAASNPCLLVYITNTHDTTSLNVMTLTFSLEALNSSQLSHMQQTHNERLHINASPGTQSDIHSDNRSALLASLISATMHTFLWIVNDIMSVRWH